MTKAEFRRRWDTPDGGGITFDDIAQCAVEWGLYAKPKTMNIFKVVAAVVEAAGCKDQYEEINHEGGD